MTIITKIKKSLLPLLLLINLASCNNETGADKNKSTPDTKPAAVASYYLQVPSGWKTEIISFPIEFAPGIPYTGTEDLRFSRGWEDINSDEHWCYAFAWWLDGKPLITEDTLEQHLTAYYSGLVNRNIIERKIPENKILPTVVTVKAIEKMTGDITTYKGNISLLDYLAGNPIILNCMIHIKDCDTKDRTALLFQISPRPLSHPVWNQLNTLNTNFTCGN